MPTKIDVALSEIDIEYQSFKTRILQKRHDIVEERRRLEAKKIESHAQLQGLTARIEGIHFTYNRMAGIIQRDPNQLKQKKTDLAHVTSKINEKEKEIRAIESSLKSANKNLESLKDNLGKIKIRFQKL